MSEKAIFESRDVGAVTNHLEAENPKKYMNAERRRYNRRCGDDRRNDVRFESGKADRREGHGRREDDSAPTFW